MPHLEFAELRIQLWTPPGRNEMLPQFKCETCQRVYCRKESLRRHVTFECNKEPQFQCTVCGKKCKLKSNLQQHVRLCHKNLFEAYKAFYIQQNDSSSVI